MIYTSDLQELMSQWAQRSADIKYPESYRDAIKECYFELDNLMVNYFNQEALAHEFFEQQEADNVLAIEASEYYN